MPKVSKVLQAALDQCDLKTNWSSTVNAMLGPDRRVSCFLDADPATTDPAASGVEFLNVGSTGTIPSVGGNITGLGTLKGTSKKLPADLSIGHAVLVLSGNGHSIEFTLGLAGSGKEFELSRNPSGAAGEGFAIKPGSLIRAPILLDSGTGPLSPAVDLDSDPTIVVAARLCDWSSGSRVPAGTIYFDHREENLVLENPWMAREIGDVRRYRTADDGHITWGSGGDAYVIGGDILIANELINEETKLPLQQVEIRMMPDRNQRWSTYPFKGGFDIAIDTLAPPAHKIELLNCFGGIIDVIEMYSTRDATNTPGSGWPVNDPRLQNTDWHNSYKPIQSKWTCREVHAWFSHRPKRHSKMAHILPGVTLQSMDPRNVSGFSSDPEQWPVITDNFLMNGLGSYRVAPKWSRAKDGGLDTTIVDKAFNQIERDHWVTQAVGYGFEPGATGKHTHFMAPGGSRHDRACYSHGMVMWASNPDGKRVHGNAPWREIMHHWYMNYFNHHHHYFTDVNTGKSIGKSQILNGEVCYNGCFYNGGNENYRPNLGTNAIELFSYVNVQHGNSYKRDKNGNLFTNEWSRDVLHSQSTAATGAYQTASPRHVLEAAHSFRAHILGAFDVSQNFSKDKFLVRLHAWHMWQFANIWLMGNNQPDGFTTAEIEQMWARHLEQVHDAVMPEYVAQNTLFGVSLKRYGIPLGTTTSGDGTFNLGPTSDLDSKSFYFGQVLMFMKQTGSYDRMRAYSPKCKAAIDLIVDSLAKWGIDSFVDGKGRVDRGFWRWIKFSGKLEDLPATWNELQPPDGLMDWIHFPSGDMTAPDNPVDNVNTKHFHAQWLWILRDYFPELDYPRLDEAIAIVEDFYAQVEATKASTYWSFRFAMMGQFLPPDYAGAPVLQLN